MSQSNRIFAFLAAAFVVFITMRGELRTYYGFLVGCGGSAPAPAQAPAPTQTGSNAGGGGVGQVASAAAEFLPLFL